MFFINKKKIKQEFEKENNSTEEIENQNFSQTAQYPRICAFDFDENTLKKLNNNQNIIYYGALGTNIVNIPNENFRSNCYLKFYSDIPNNFQEYQIFAFNLCNNNEEEYNPSKFKRAKRVTTNEDHLICIEYPQTVFIQKNLALNVIKYNLKKISNEKNILIIFADKKKDITYSLYNNTSRGFIYDSEIEINTYDFLPINIDSSNISGKYQKVIKPFGPLKTILNEYIDSFEYNLIFNLDREDSSMYPLIENEKGQITSFIKVINDTLIITLPSSNKSEEILIRLIHEILPTIKPKLFPYSQLFSWLSDDKFLFPEVKEFYKQKEKLKSEYNLAAKKIDDKIVLINEKSSFLHSILTETGDNLVSAVKTYLEWLGFENITISDESKTEEDFREEDLSFIYNGIQFLVEVKGIGGTSKDTECSQVLKIVNRYMKRTKNINVKGIYIVNHQRYQSPELRTNPPFNQTQIEDAINDDRLMITTYDLFKLYYNIENILIDATWAKNQFIKKGTTNFLPDEDLYIGYVRKTYQEDSIASVIIEKNSITLNEEILIINKDVLSITKTLSIELNKKPLKKVKTSESPVGIKFSNKILRNSKLYKITTTK